MSKIRIYELAKQLGVANKELVAKINSIGIEAKSHMAMLTEEDAARVTALYRPKQEAPKQEAKTPKKAPEKAVPKKEGKPQDGKAKVPFGQKKEAGREQKQERPVQAKKPNRENAPKQNVQNAQNAKNTQGGQGNVHQAGAQQPAK